MEDLAKFESEHYCSVGRTNRAVIFHSNLLEVRGILLENNFSIIIFQGDVMILKHILFFVLLLFITSNFSELTAKPKMFKVRKEDSQVEFSITKWAIFKEEGRFKEFDGTILYDPENPTMTTVDFTVYTGSVDSRNSGRDNAIRSEEIMNVKDYPTMTFKSLQVKALAKDSLSIEGILTMRGIAKRVTVPVKVAGMNYVSEIGTMIGYETTFAVNREEFGIAKNWDVIGKDVTIHLLIGASSKD
jgi:polyisoprenoid-binding protein YceI